MMLIETSVQNRFLFTALKLHDEINTWSLP